MSEINILVKRSLEENLLIFGILSNPRKGTTEYKKVTIKPVVLKDELKFQFAYILDRNTVHKNLDTSSKKNALISALWPKMFWKRGADTAAV